MFEQYYYRARYYGPDIGRFTSQDPLAFGGGDANLYRYVGNNAISFTDPLGLQRFSTATGEPIADDGQIIDPPGAKRGPAEPPVQELPWIDTWLIALPA